MKVLWVISGLAALGAVAWYFMRQGAVPVGVAAPDAPYVLPNGGTTFSGGAGDVAQAIVSGGAHAVSTPAAPGYKLIATLHPPSGPSSTPPPPPTPWRKV